MRGFDPATYGDRFADVYDEWYPDPDGAEHVTRVVSGWTAPGDRVLELGAGTGRLAIPIAATGREVWALDASSAMLERLAAKPGGDRVHTVHSDMAAELPDGPFAVVFAALNTIFSLPSAEAQEAAVASVAERLGPGGRFAIEAFVPREPDGLERPDGPDGESDRITVRSMSADAVVLSISRTRHADRVAEGHHVELRHGQPVVLRPWSIRYALPAELDAAAAAAGLHLECRWSDWSGAPFDEESRHHVSVYRHHRWPAVAGGSDL